MRRAHLTKVLVQTVWVVVDDKTGIATEFADSGVSIPAGEWPTFYERHCADFASIQAATVEGSQAEPNGMVPNRAARRTKT